MRTAFASASRIHLPQSDWRVLGAVAVLLSSYSKVTDEAFVAQIAATANVGKSTARRSMKKLAAHGILVYEGQRGPGSGALISFAVGRDAESVQHGEHPHGDPGGEQSTDEEHSVSAAECSSSLAPTEKSLREDDVGALLEQLLQEHLPNFGAAQRALARKDPARTRAWIERGLGDVGIRNFSGWMHERLQSGTWPPARTKLRSADSPCPRRGIGSSPA